MSTTRAYRAGETLEDYCRVCKIDRRHTVIAADPLGAPLRVACGYCGSEHDFRGGPKGASLTRSSEAVGTLRTASPSTSTAGEPVQRAPREGLSTVSDRERSAPPIVLPQDSSGDLELLLRRIIREETGITPVAPAEKWRGGTLVLRPATAGPQEKSWPIETFFHKVVMIRNRLRTLEQQVNASDLPDDVKLKLQAYVSGCYGTLTSFNVLFADDEDQFRGTGGD
jgi:hypothetical protein